MKEIDIFAVFCAATFHVVYVQALFNKRLTN